MTRFISLVSVLVVVASSILLSCSLSVSSTGLSAEWSNNSVLGKLPVKLTGESTPQYQVHIVSHTHDDVGWLKTVDQYYHGANNSIQHAGVKFVLNSVIPQLMADPARRFIYVEQAFFQMWWQTQDDVMKANVKALVKAGQLEFVNGGWCMHDEANTHYLDMIDQTTLGHQYLLKEFGVAPTIGWQIDPFGHSGTQASLLSAEVGFDALFFSRIDYQDHQARAQSKNLEYIWRGSPTLGATSQVFTGAFASGGYGPPKNFCFDLSCSDIPIVSDVRDPTYNAPDRVNAFVAQVYDLASVTRGTNVMFTMGEDFEYENADEWYSNLDQLIKIVNADGRVNVFYSTPSAYVAAKHAEQLTFEVKTDDHFPYADDSHSYWTGYFTSRPALKRYIRASSALLQAARHIDAINGGDGSANLAFAKAVAVTQHHDAVAGTSKQHVAFDYAQRLHKGQVETQNMVAAGLARMVTENHPGSLTPQFAFCELSNITVCATTTTVAPSSFTVLLYNSLAHVRTELVSIPVASDNLVVYDSIGVVIPSQTLVVFNTSAHQIDSAPYSINFLARVQPLGFNTFFVVAKSADDAKPKKHHSSNKHHHSKKSDAVESALTEVAGGTISISNEFITLSFVNGVVSSYFNRATNQSHALTSDFVYYDSFQNAPGLGGSQASGAYIFRPANSAAPTPVSSAAPILYVQNGPIVSQVVQVINEWANQTYRLVAGRAFVEAEYTVGPVPVDDAQGKEVVTRYTTGLDTRGAWQTDSSAREMQLRQRNARESFNLTLPLSEPTSCNYVPMNAAASMKDFGSTQFTVLNDRSQGVASMIDGQLEIMVHRRTTQDDRRGVGEPIDETSNISPYPDFTRSGPGLIITGKHYLMFTTIVDAAAAWRPIMQRVYQPLVVVFAPLAGGAAAIPNYIASHNVDSSYAYNDASLPANVELITFEAFGQWTGNNDTYLVRFAHLFAAGDDAVLSLPVTINLAEVFISPPTSVTEVSLTANANISLDGERKRLDWNVIEPAVPSGDHPYVPFANVPTKGEIVTLGAMQIKTFILTF